MANENIGNLSWVFNPTQRKLHISGNGEMKRFPFQKRPWEAHKRDIETVEIEAGITSISDGAFIDCYNLTKVYLPDTVGMIAPSAFANCEKLVDIVIPDSVTIIGCNAFEHCHSITNIAIPYNVRYIEQETFSGCVSLEKIAIPYTLSAIGNQAFCGCKKLKRVFISNATWCSPSAFNSSCEIIRRKVVEDSIATENWENYALANQLKNIYYCDVNYDDSFIERWTMHINSADKDKANLRLYQDIYTCIKKFYQCERDKEYYIKYGTYTNYFESLEDFYPLEDLLLKLAETTLRASAMMNRLKMLCPCEDMEQFITYIDKKYHIFN